MNKYIFDSNIFDKFLDGSIDLKVVNKNKSISFYTTHIQRDQLKATPNTDKRKKLLQIFKQAPQIKIPTNSFILGTSKLGEAKLSSGINLSKILGNKNSNSRNFKDALIAEVALENKLMFVSDDKTLKNSLNRQGGNAISFDEFIKTNSAS